jgi:hypothetical protein
MILLTWSPTLATKNKYVARMGQPECGAKPIYICVTKHKA